MFVCHKLNNIVMGFIKEIWDNKLDLSQSLVYQKFYTNIQILVVYIKHATCLYVRNLNTSYQELCQQKENFESFTKCFKILVKLPVPNVSDTASWDFFFFYR